MLPKIMLGSAAAELIFDRIDSRVDQVGLSTVRATGESHGTGAVQAAAPWLLGAAKRPEGALIRAARGWALALCLVPAVLALSVWLAGAPETWLTVVLILGLMAFGALFAVNSSLHSYLILAFTRAERVTMDVGFYYMANAGGRLLGTLPSGLTYQIGGLALVLGTAALMVGLSAIAAGKLHVEGAEATA